MHNGFTGHSKQREKPGHSAFSGQLTKTEKRAQNRLGREIKNPCYSIELSSCLLSSVDRELFICKYMGHFPSFPHTLEVNHLLMNVFSVLVTAQTGGFNATSAQHNFFSFIIVFVAFSFKCLCGLLDFPRQLASRKHKHRDGQGPGSPRPVTNAKSLG